MDKNKKENFRSPIVTIMGHVDHGKTTLLDAIRKTNVVAREHGGITQHIGAYQITFEGKPITFVDTPGHAAFEKMRSRGAEVADIVILVVAANDSVKPQTTEAIKHIQKAKKPTVVAITKTDLPAANVEKVKKDLAAAGVVVESVGGQTPVVEVVAPKGKGLSELLEVIQLVWQLSPEVAKGQDPLETVVVESFLDKNRGPVVTVIVKTGTLYVGQKIAVDDETITVKALFDDMGKSIKVAKPGKPAEILGFKKILDVGSIVKDQNITGSQKGPAAATITDIIAKSEAVKNKFKIVLKADVAGSLEAIRQNLPENILVLSASTGEMSQSDIAFAKIAQAPIIAFNLKVNPAVSNQADREGVIIKPYNVIYQLLEDLEDVAVGFEQAKQATKVTGRGKIVATFTIVGQKIAGARITHGKLKVGDEVIIKRGEKEIGQGKIISLKRFKKDYQEISSGQDCGVGIDPVLDFGKDDIIESFGS